MSVLTRSFKQTNGYFVPLGNCQGKVLAYSGTVGAGGDAKVGAFTQALWAIPAAPNAASTTAILVSSLLAGPVLGGQVGGLFKDMGKTVVSASRTFRKVQLVVPGLSSAGVAEVAPDATFLTGYIELAGAGGFAGGLANTYAPAPVAYLPGLM
jgi:hypothetical protein